MRADGVVKFWVRLGMRDLASVAHLGRSGALEFVQQAIGMRANELGLEPVSLDVVERMSTPAGECFAILGRPRISKGSGWDANGSPVEGA